MRSNRFICLILTISLLFFANKAYSKSDYDIQVIPLLINGIYVKDIEVRQYKNSRIVIPTKEIAQVLEVPFSYNQSYKKVVIEDTFICASNDTVLYAKNEIIKDFFDDIFVSDEKLSKLLKADIVADNATFSVNIKTDKKLAILEGVIVQPSSENSFIAAQIVKEVIPEPKQDFMLKSMNINGALNFYNNQQGNIETNYSNNMMHTQLKARCFDGDLKVINDFTANDSKLKISGIRMNLKKDIKDTKVEIISLEPTKIDDISLAGSLVGVKTVKETDKQKTTIYAGTTDYNTYMFKDYKNDMTKKIVAGGVVEKKINEKLNLSLGAVHDNLVGKASQSNFYNQILSNISPSLVSFSTYKNLNNVSGDTLFSSAKYTLNDKISFEPFFGVSNSYDYVHNGINPNGAGLGGSFKTIITKDKNNFSNKLFYYSPDFYFAGNTGYGSSSQNMSDRAGVQNILTHSNKFFSINARAENYLADLENRLYCGGITVGDYSLSGALKVTPKTAVNYSFVQRNSTNDKGSFEIQNGSLYCTKGITSKLSGTANFNFFGNKLNDVTTQNTSLTKKYILGCNYRMPKQLGNFSLEHEVTDINNSSSSTMNSFRLRAGYNLPRIWKIAPSFNVGMPYAGNMMGLDYNISLNYMLNTGQELRIGYSFNRQNAYLFDGIYIPSYSRNAFMVNFVDNLSLYGGVKPLTLSSDNYGFVKVCAFCDKNENGQFDKDEKIVPNVSLKIQSFSSPFTTGKKGDYSSPALKEGNYMVSVDKGNMLSFYGTESNNENFMAKVERDKITKISIPIISTPGSILGKVKITDDLGNDVIIGDLPVSIYDASGQEVNYSSTDEEMNFNITGLRPGKYTVKIGDEFLEAYGLTQKSKAMEVVIPDISDDNFVVTNINLEFLQKDFI